jgi:uncharacterized membrane protein YeaQ/YmgE (transglycosylase-associated protein family)
MVSGKVETMIAEALAGIVSGVFAWYVIPDSIGVGADTLLGLVGGGLGAFIYKLFGHRIGFDGFNAWSVASAVIGALAVILVSRAAAGRRTIA